MLGTKSSRTVNDTVLKIANNEQYFTCVAVLSNTAEERLFRHLIDKNQHDLRTIPAAHHVGQTLEIDIRLALRKIIKMVGFQSFDH